MSFMKKAAMSVAFAAAFLSSAPTVAAPATIYLRAYVPVYCNVELFPALSATSHEGVINLGTSQELCNSPHGYRIILEHPANMVGAVVIRDATRIPFSQDGETVLWDSDQAGFESRQLAVDLGHGPATLDRLGLRIDVKY